MRGPGVGSMTQVVPGLESVAGAAQSAPFPVESYGSFTLQMLPADLASETADIEGEAVVYGSLRRDARADRPGDWFELGSFTEADAMTGEFPVVVVMVEVTAVASGPLMVVWVGG